MICKRFLIVVCVLAGIALPARDVRQKKPVTSDPKPEKYVIRPGKEWVPIEFRDKTIAGSPLDFSIAEGPAGQKGFVILTKEGHLAFEKEPRKRVRFFGPNLVHDTNTPTKEDADLLVAELVKMGYNTVRLHHYEKPIQDMTAPSSLAIHAEKLDKFFYLISKLKENGIYITIDLYVSRQMRPGDNFPELPPEACSRQQVMKPLILVSPTAMENWKAYSRKLLTTKNPYTGLSLKEDPVLWSLNLVNENSAYMVLKKAPELQPLFEQKYFEYLKSKGLNTAENRTKRTFLFREFLIELQGKCMDEQIRFLRKELGVRALIADLNFRLQFSLIQLRDKLDIVDNHFYWDHPTFPEKQWHLPEKYQQESCLKALGHLPRVLVSSRIFGKPYMLTEYDFVYPNIYRAEEASMLGSYASLQDLDDLNRFAWTHSSRKLHDPSHKVGFDCISDPLAKLTEKITQVLFLRGDVSAAKEGYSAVFMEKHKSAGDLHTEIRGDFLKLGYYARIGTLMEGKTISGVRNLDPFAENWQEQLASDAKKALDKLNRTGQIVSSTGEITLDSRAGTLKVVTPKSEVFTFTKSISGDVATFRGGDLYQTVAVIAKDGLPLKMSRSILIYHLTDQARTGETYRDDSMKLLLSAGKMPILMRRSKITAELNLPAGFKVQALTLSGEPNGEIQARFKEGKYTFVMDNAARKGGVLIYHLTR